MQIVIKHLLFVTLLFCTNNIYCQQTIQGKVIKIIDGDTFDLLLENFTTIRVRMNGIDCPEKKQPYFKNAKQALANFIFGKKVQMVSKTKDKYKRTLAEVFYKNENINLKMVANGFAWHFKKYSSNTILAKAEINARIKKIGLWSLPFPIAPWDYRATK
jgi:endonuclease YncB( thermonuclease family)